MRVVAGRCGSDVRGVGGAGRGGPGPGQRPFAVSVAYEAGPTGFVLARQLTAAGIRRVVAAPSKLQRPPGDRVKTDARDALHLARLLRMDQIVEVRVPVG